MGLAVCEDCHIHCGWKVTLGAGTEKDQTISVMQRQRGEGLDSGNGRRRAGKEVHSYQNSSFYTLCCLALG